MRDFTERFTAATDALGAIDWTCWDDPRDRIAGLVLQASGLQTLLDEHARMVETQAIMVRDIRQAAVAAAVNVHAAPADILTELTTAAPEEVLRIAARLADRLDGG